MLLLLLLLLLLFFFTGRRQAKALSAPTPTRSDQNDFGACRAWSLSIFARSFNSNSVGDLDILKYLKYRALSVFVPCDNCCQIIPKEKYLKKYVKFPKNSDKGLRTNSSVCVCVCDGKTLRNTKKEIIKIYKVHF